MPLSQESITCRKGKPADGSEGTDFVDKGKKPVSIEGVEAYKQEGNEHFKAGDYLHAAASYAFGLSTLDELGTMHTRDIHPVRLESVSECNVHLKAILRPVGRRLDPVSSTAMPSLGATASQEV